MSEQLLLWLELYFRSWFNSMIVNVLLSLGNEAWFLMLVLLHLCSHIQCLVCIAQLSHMSIIFRLHFPMNIKKTESLLNASHLILWYYIQPKLTYRKQNSVKSVVLPKRDQIQTHMLNQLFLNLEANLSTLDIRTTKNLASFIPSSLNSSWSLK